MGNGTTTFNFLGMTTIAIKSLTDTEGLELDVLPVTILCDEGSGFSFINTTNVSIAKWYQVCRLRSLSDYHQ